jgi:hypothetical protein
MLTFVGINPGQFVESMNFACDLDCQIAGIEAGNPPHAAGARQGGAAKLFVADAIGTNHTHACDDNASLLHENNLMFLWDLGSFMAFLSRRPDPRRGSA